MNREIFPKSFALDMLSRIIITYTCNKCSFNINFIEELNKEYRCPKCEGVLLKDLNCSEGVNLYE